MSPIAHSPSEIEAILRRGFTPKTDNEDALLELGFERASPASRDDYDSTLWERSSEHPQRSSGGTRMLVRERAVLVDAPVLLTGPEDRSETGDDIA